MDHISEQVISLFDAVRSDPTNIAGADDATALVVFRRLMDADRDKDPREVVRIAMCHTNPEPLLRYAAGNYVSTAQERKFYEAIGDLPIDEVQSHDGLINYVTELLEPIIN